MSGMSARLHAGGNLCWQLLRREREAPVRDLHSNLLRDRLRLVNNFCHRNIAGNFSCVNAIEFSYGGQYLASGGDDTRIRIWDVDKAVASVPTEPITLIGQHNNNIFGLAFDGQNRKVYSCGNDEYVMIHDFDTRYVLNQYVLGAPVYGISVRRNSDNIVAVAVESGELQIIDTRTERGRDLVIMTANSNYNAVQFHPLDSDLLASANSLNGAALWDIRNVKQPQLQYHHNQDSPSCTSVCFNKTGSQLLTLQRRLPPILYDTKHSQPVCTFYDQSYFNSCTMKSCCFAGPDDELILSGSDNFNLYAWRLDNKDVKEKQWVERADMMLQGHRSVVNQVRYNRERCLLASSGVEKIIKLWSPFQCKGWTGELLVDREELPKMRPAYPLRRTPSDNLYQETTDEDLAMLGFFDSLVRHELESITDFSEHTDDDDVDDNDNDFSRSDSGLVQDVDDAAEHRDVEGANEEPTGEEEQPNIITTLLKRKQSRLRQLAIDNFNDANSSLFRVSAQTDSDESDSYNSLASPSDLYRLDDQPSTSTFAEYRTQLQRTRSIFYRYTRAISSTDTDTTISSTDSDSSDIAQTSGARKRKLKYSLTERNVKRHRAAAVQNQSMTNRLNFSESSEDNGDLLNHNTVDEMVLADAAEREELAEEEEEEEEEEDSDDESINVICDRLPFGGGDGGGTGSRQRYLYSSSSSDSSEDENDARAGTSNNNNNNNSLTREQQERPRRQQ